MMDVNYTKMDGTMGSPEFVNVDIDKAFLNRPGQLTAVTAVSRVVKVAKKFIEPIKRFHLKTMEAALSMKGEALSRQEMKINTLQNNIAGIEKDNVEIDQKIETAIDKLATDDSGIAYKTVSLLKEEKANDEAILENLKDVKLQKELDKKDRMAEGIQNLADRYGKLSAELEPTHPIISKLDAVDQQVEPSVSVPGEMKEPRGQGRIAQLFGIVVHSIDGENKTIELQFESGRTITHSYKDEYMTTLAKQFPNIIASYDDVKTKATTVEEKQPENALAVQQIEEMPKVEVAEQEEVQETPTVLPEIKPITLEPIVETTIAETEKEEIAPVVEAAPVVETTVGEPAVGEATVEEKVEEKSAQESAQIFKDEGFTAKEKELNRLEGKSTNVDGPFNHIVSTAEESARAFIENGLTSFERILKDKDRENDELRGVREVVEKENEQLKTVNTSLVEENNASKLKIESLSQNNESSKNEIENLKQSNEDLAKANEALRNDIKALTDNFKQLQGQFAAFFQQLNVQANENGQELTR